MRFCLLSQLASKPVARSVKSFIEAVRGPKQTASSLISVLLFQVPSFAVLPATAVVDTISLIKRQLMLFWKCSLYVKRLTLLAGCVLRHNLLLGNKFLERLRCRETALIHSTMTRYFDSRETNALERDDNLERSYSTKLFQALRLLLIKGAGWFVKLKSEFKLL